MAMNFNKILIQDYLTKRETSYTHDFNDDQSNKTLLEMNDDSIVDDDDDDDELDEEDDDNDMEMYDVDDHDRDDVGEYGKITEMGKLNETISSLPGKKMNGRQLKLIAALESLRSAVNKQADLQNLYNEKSFSRPQKDSDKFINNNKLLSIQEQNIDNIVDLNEEIAIDERSCCANNVLRKEKSTDLDDESKDDTSVQNTIKELTKKNSTNSESKRNSDTEKELLSFKRNERLTKKKERVTVQVRVVFLKIGEIDTLKEIYHADAFIQAKWREPRLDGKADEWIRKVDLQRCWNPLILIDNILTESKEQHWITTQRNHLDQIFIVERRRLRGVFLETLELNDFPLDVQDLTITLTSERPETEIELIPDKLEPCRINLQTFVDQQEWHLHEHIEVTRRSATQEYTNSSQNHPCLSVTCRAARRPGYFYWNVFLIMFFITGLSFATFAVPPERPENRLQLSFTLFLTSVAFKFVINQSLPKISYLTYMDKYVLMSLAILCVVSIWHAVVTLIPSDAEFEQLTAKNTLKSVDPNYSFLKQYKDLTLSPRILSTASPIPTSVLTTTLVTTSNEQERKKNYTLITNKEADTLLMNTTPKFGINTVNAEKYSQANWIALALQTKNREQQKRRLMMRIERDVFISFCILYILAHLTFVFWLYFDASRRRREMFERDRLYKKCLQASKVSTA